MSVVARTIRIHAEESAFLWLLRRRAVAAPHYRLDHLARLDNRVAAHVDGLRVAGEAGWEMLVEQLGYEEVGEVFAAGVLALESKAGARLNRVVEVAERVPETVPGLVSALGWVEPSHLQGTGRALLDAASPFLRRLGIAACAIHRADPGPRLNEAIDDPEPLLRARALRAAGELGRADLLETLRGHLADDDEGCRFWAAWAAVLVGDRGRALATLLHAALAESPWRDRALALAPRLLAGEAARRWLKGLASDPAQLRALIRAVGVYGDPYYVPWLVGQMRMPRVARPAGEAFSMITGVDLAYQDLEGARPEGFESGPTEDPEDDDVALDPDEDLACPYADRVERWWQAEKPRFAAGVRHLCGRPITDAQCREVLLAGYQRQRIAAAFELALMRSDRPLFETRAPAFRQQAQLRRPAG